MALSPKTPYLPPVNWTDFDGDGDLDLFVSNEANQPDDLYENDGAGILPKSPAAQRPAKATAAR